MKNNNKGFSLIELIVVIAIMSIAAVGATLSYSAVKNADVKKAAVSTESLLKGTRTECMSKSSPQYMYIYNDGDDYYYVLSNDSESTYVGVSSLDNPTKLCSSKVTINCETESGSYDIDASDYAKITFEKSTGAVDFECGIHDGKLKKISFVKGNKQYGVDIAYETGKTSLNAG